MNLEANYRLHLARKERDELDLERDEQEIVRKSRLYELAPISEITKRGWIQTTDLIDELEQSVSVSFRNYFSRRVSQITINFRHSQKYTRNSGSNRLAQTSRTPPKNRRLLSLIAWF